MPAINMFSGRRRRCGGRFKQYSIIVPADIFLPANKISFVYEHIQVFTYQQFCLYMD